LISIMYANNEIGTVEPVKEAAAIVKAFRGNEKFPLIHTDAAQAFQFLPCNAAELGVDLMTLSAHKLYGPKGVGALYMKQKISPLVTGGGQEFGLRSGTENVPGMVGFAKAVELMLAHPAESANKNIAALRERLWRGIKKIEPAAELNGATDAALVAASKAKSQDFLPNILNISFPGREAQDLLTKFDLQGLAVSSGSACRSRALTPSYVLGALGFGARSKSSIRFSLGRPTTKAEIDRAIKIIKNAL